MTVLMRAKEIIKRPVVTLAGEDVAQIKDIVYAGDHGEVAGFTLAGRGLLSGPRKEALAWTSIHSLGRDAVMITSAEVFDKRGDVVNKSDAKGGNVVASRVITDSGTDLGKVVDAILEVGEKAHVVGYAIDSSDALARDGRVVLIPLPDTISVSGEALIVPSTATEFVSDDLSGFGASVDAFRARLRGEQH
ncbi:MAG TPA: PRC-barrel domain-containing protein [Mycobacteriales bacterium]|jgi:uncharacterized protein YrrD|nr:PRC-barrel domain-containing protein [Mycobacteriales bacterium]